MKEKSAKAVARAAGHAAAAAHMADHSLGVVVYGLQAVAAAGGSVEEERAWQRRHLPRRVRALVRSALDDERFGRATRPAQTAEVVRFFADRPLALRLFRAVEKALPRQGPVILRVTKSQISISRRRGFAWVWMPGRWLRGDVAPMVLSISLRRKDRSKRWKEVVAPTPGRWMHHLELRSAKDVDMAVRAWLLEAWEQAS